MSSNIMAQTNSSVLRFVVEDAALHLSNRVSYGTVNLQRDYVCVLDIDLIELSLRLRDKPSPCDKQPTPQSTATTNKFEDIKSPFFELQASLNIVRLRTCADSCRLLLDLLTYLADDGDFDEKGIALSEDSSESGLTLRSGLNSVVGGSLSSLHGQEVEEKVNDLMAEAMLDSSPVQHFELKIPPKEDTKSNRTEVFFFPDETKPSFLKDRSSDSNEPCGVWHKEIDQQLMDEALDPACDDIPSTEEEFCILENDPGVGFTVRFGFPIPISPSYFFKNHLKS